MTDQIEQLLDIKQVATMFNVGPRTISRWVQASLFPTPYRFNRRVYRWRECDIVEFLNNKNHIREINNA